MIDAFDVLVDLGAMAMAVGWAFVVRARRRRRMRSRTLAAPEASAGIVEGTEVRIRGIVKAADELVTAPLSGASCVMYWVRASTIGAAAFADRTRSSFVRRSFVLDRGEAGQAEIDGDHVELDVPETDKRHHAAERRESTRLMLGVTGSERVHFGEVVLLPGDEVIVVGIAMLEAAPPTGFRDAAPRLRLAGSPDHPVTITLVERATAP